jgi:oxygen-independent coproporphyrinogen-3 oxidase
MTEHAPRSLYVHVPFCLSVCPYCDFVVQGGRASTERGGLLDPFLDALLAELELRSSGAAGAQPVGGLETVYLGGGTPSLLGAARIDRLLGAVDERLGMTAGAEVTIELNPGPRDRGDIGAFARAGVTRVSIGAQSFDDAELRRLGRRHRARDVADTVAEARAAGISSVNLDLLYDAPGQTLEAWAATLDAALALVPDHVSAYALTLDDPDAEGLTGPTGDHLPLRRGARRWRERAAGEQDAERAAEMYRAADARFAAAGLRWYEISNWARPGHRCRHNLAYWRREPTLALGPGAHGFDGRRRWWNAAPIAGYIAALAGGPGRRPSLPPGGSERVEGKAAIFEAAMLRLRLADGLEATPDTHEAGARAADDPQVTEALAWGRSAGLIEGTPPALSLEGRLLADELLVRMA